MSDNKKSRRDFLFGRFAKTAEDSEIIEKVKMLTPDGKLVYVDRRLIKGQSGTPSRNADILSWMKNASKPKEKSED